MKTVAMALFPDFLLLDMAGPLEVFSIANRYLPPAQHYRILILGTESGPLRASNGVMVQADLLLEEALDAYDLLLVPGGPGAYNECHPALLPWLRAAVPRARRFGSICTGAFVLGYAGLLDGHRVTTHWHYTERLIKAFPKAIVETDRIYLQDGRLITSGGVTAGIDLALSVVAQDHGKQVAVEVAKVLLVVMKRQGGQAQFSPMTSAVAPQETPITRVQNHVLANLEQSFTVESMAALVDMSARHLLETTELPLKTVAFHAGFGSVRHMRFLFSEKLGLTPTQYRQQFS
jgi:transcriptional regulator GlxA family with amidase domain